MPRKPDSGKPRRTLAQALEAGMQQETAERQGLRCSNCNCPDLRVAYRRDYKGMFKRVRVCRHCGRRVVTFESYPRPGT